MKVAFITDTHFGRGQDSLVLDAYFRKFYDEIFFPYLKKEKINSIIHLGDLFDRRRFVNFDILNRVQNYFLDAIQKFDFHLIIGNHDIYHSETNKLNAPSLLMDVNQFHGIHSMPTEVELPDADGFKFLFLPWITKENWPETQSIIERTDAKIVLGHLDINGFEMDRGNINKEGINRSLFSKFHMVYTGHFHHKNGTGNILYLGCPYEQTWADCDDPKGFHVFDTDTMELTFIQNPFTIFKKWIYDDVNGVDDIMKVINNSADDFVGKFIKIIVENRVQHNLFDSLYSVISKAGVHDISVIDRLPGFVINNGDTTQIVSEQDVDESVLNEDTEQIIRHYVETVTYPEHIKPEIIVKEMDALYREAQSLEYI